MNAESKSPFAAALAAWYRSDHRDLPWRRTQDPYAIWLSEIMLQQTRVETVIAYYERFLTRFPTVAELAQSPQDQALKLWEGLGYYARCRNLHRAAQEMVEKHDGKVPDTPEELIALPGIGTSTAHAILTFGHGQSHPLLDGNVKRVLSRLYDIDKDIRRSAVQKTMWGHSATLLENATDPWTHNQAIMELGARLCTPRDPDCGRCPVQSLCDAHAAGTQHERPVSPRRKAIPHKHIGVGVIWQENQVLIQRRPPNGLLGGLWEFPGGKQETNETIEETVRRECAEELGITVRVQGPIAQVKHAYSHFRITLHAFHCQYISGDPEPKAATAWRWSPIEALSDYAFPKANKVVLKHLVDGHRPPHSEQTS